MKKDQKETDVEFAIDEEIAAEENLKEKIKELKVKLKACEKDKNEYLAGWQRSRADYLNFKNEVHAHQTKLRQTAQEEILLEFLSLADNFDLAFSHQESWNKLPSDWRQGIEQIHKQLLKIFHRHHLEMIDPIGQTFDPAQHHSLGEEKVADPTQDGKVVTVIKKGYKLGERVIRPAEVKVGVTK